MPRNSNAVSASQQTQEAVPPRKQEDLLDDSAMTTKFLRTGLHELLDIVNGMSLERRNKMAPIIEELLRKSQGAPTMFEVVRSRRHFAKPEIKR